MLIKLNGDGNPVFIGGAAKVRDIREKGLIKASLSYSLNHSNNKEVGRSE